MSLGNRHLQDRYRNEDVRAAAAYLEGGGSVEGTARALFLHANTVRYRLKKLTDVVGYDLTAPREALVVRLALLLGRTAPRL